MHARTHTSACSRPVRAFSPWGAQQSNTLIEQGQDALIISFPPLKSQLDEGTSMSVCGTGQAIFQAMTAQRSKGRAQVVPVNVAEGEPGATIPASPVDPM